MRAIDKAARILAVALLLLAYPSSKAAEIEFAADGWYVWEVEAGTHGRQACCYSWNGGVAAMTGCQLDGRQRGFSITDDCSLNSDRLRVYVQVQSGIAGNIRALSAGCPVQANGEIADLGAISTDASIDWLNQQIKARPGRSSELLAAVSMHADPAAFTSLTGFVEDRSMDQNLREEALFWLAQSDSNLAFDYLERLLSRR